MNRLSKKVVGIVGMASISLAIACTKQQAVADATLVINGATAACVVAKAALPIPEVVAACNIEQALAPQLEQWIIEFINASAQRKAEMQKSLQDMLDGKLSRPKK